MMYLCLSDAAHPVLGLHPSHKFYKINGANLILGLVRQEIACVGEIDPSEVGGDMFCIRRDGIYEASSQYFEGGDCLYREVKYYTYINSKLREISEKELLGLLSGGVGM